jgi:hypothetical protein
MAAAARPLRRDWIDNDEKRMTVDRRSDGIYAEITSMPIRSVVVASLSFSLSPSLSKGWRRGLKEVGFSDLP